MNNPLRSALRQIRQRPLVTTLYLLGVAMAVATVMILAIVYHTRLSDIYPETNRSRMAYISQLGARTEGRLGLSAIGYDHIYQWTDSLPEVEATAIVYGNYFNSAVEMPDGELQVVISKAVSPEFFTVFPYKFVAGKTFTKAQFDNHEKVAVINTELAGPLFGSPEQAVGCQLVWGGIVYHVGGVVKDASTVTHEAYGDMFIPFTSVTGYDEIDSRGAGSYKAYLLMKDGADLEKVRKEVAARVERTSQENGEYSFTVFGQPYTHLEMTFDPEMLADRKNFYESDDVEVPSSWHYYLTVGMILLLVPALNLSGLVGGNVSERAEEMGIRKSFGATRRALLGEILAENLMLTIFGAVIGLALSWCLIVTWSDWILAINGGETFNNENFATVITPEMLFSPVVFLIALGAAVILNLVSAMLPAWWALRHPIVESLNFDRR